MANEPILVIDRTWIEIVVAERCKELSTQQKADAVEFVVGHDSHLNSHMADAIVSVVNEWKGWQNITPKD